MSTETRIRIYTTPTCGFCQAAKRLLGERDVPYEEIDVSDPGKRAEIQSEHDWSTVPIVLIDGELVGGYTELEALDRREGLDHLRAAQ